MNARLKGLWVGACALGLGMAGTAVADDQTAPPPPPPPAGAAPASPPAPAANPMANPSMSGTLAANPNPFALDIGPLGKVNVDAVVSGLALWQSNPAHDFFGNQNRDDFLDVSNAQLIINKQDGPFQFYLQVGYYSIPALGVPYYRAGTQTPDSFGYVPQGFIKIVPTSSFSFEVGALPTLIGAEYTFTFENLDIERGLLWGQEPAVSKGVQVNYSKGPIAASIAYTDGYNSNTYASISGLITYTFKNSDTLAFDGEGAVATYRPNSILAGFVTPPEQANGQIYNLMYSHSKGPLTISPYLQYSSTPNIAGVSSGSDAWGVAVLAKWSFTPKFAVAGRAEYIGSHGAGNPLGYGDGSDAWSITFTPTYQMGMAFVRGEISYVGISSGTPGLMFGSRGLSNNQTRGLIELGGIF